MKYVYPKGAVFATFRSKVSQEGKENKKRRSPIVPKETTGRERYLRLCPLFSGRPEIERIGGPAVAVDVALQAVRVFPDGDDSLPLLLTEHDPVEAGGEDGIRPVESERILEWSAREGFGLRGGPMLSCKTQRVVMVGKLLWSTDYEEKG